MKKVDIDALSNSNECRDLVCQLYLIINEKSEDYIEWKKDFRLLHGEFDKQKKVNYEYLQQRYQVKVNDLDSFFRLVFALESLYVGLLKCFIYHRINLKNKKSYNKQWINNQIFFDFNISKNYTYLIRTDDVSNQLLFKVYDNIISKMNLISDFDFVRELYEDLFDKRIRHSVGEYFTPDWLAKLMIIKTVNNQDINNKKFLDPTCGSGTFLKNIIKLYKKKTNGEVFHNIYGIDINPVSVFAAKTNYFIEYFNYFDIPPNSLPIYEADIIKEIDYSGEFFDFDTVKITDSIGKVDYIIGNPPWVNWEYMPESYKMSTAKAWRFFNLYDGKGLDSQFLKEDISVLITYSVIHKYLCMNGKLGFLLKESLIKSVRQAKSFREFYISPSATPLKVEYILDLTNVSPFEGINPRTIGLFLTKNEETAFPFLYRVLKTKSGKRRFKVDLDFYDIEKDFYYEDLLATPSDLNDKTSPLKTLDKNLYELSKNIHGTSFYKARTGTFTGGLNAVYWIDILKSNGTISKIENIIGRAKNKVEEIRTEVENNHLYPFITGADIGFWNYNYDKYIILPHTSESKMQPINHEEIAKLPLTKEYFEHFKTDLEKRKGFTSMDKHIHNEYYYSLQRIGDYTFAPYKVAWKYISKFFTPVVIEDVKDKFLGEKTLIPNEKIIYIGLQDKQEAYFVCGVLSSTLYTKTIESFMIGTQISPSIISNLKLMQFDINNEIHNRISALCYQGHNDDICKKTILNKIDKLVYKLIKSK